MNRLENLLELEKHLVEIKKLAFLTGINFEDHYEAMYIQWRLEYGRERKKESE